MNDLDRLAEMVEAAPDGTMDAPMMRRRLARLAPELIAEVCTGRTLEACPDHADACCNDWCAVCRRSQVAEVAHTKATIALDAKLAEVLGDG